MICMTSAGSCRSSSRYVLQLSDIRASTEWRTKPIQATVLSHEPLIPSGSRRPNRCPELKSLPKDSVQPGILTGLFEAIQAGLLQQAKFNQLQPLSLSVDSLYFHPPGAETSLLQGISFKLPAGSMGLIYGRSGAGKTTLLHVLAGLLKQNSGSIALSFTSGDPRKAVQLSSSIGLVFQFPERYFLGSTIYEELSFAWPEDPWQRQAASAQLSEVLAAVDLDQVSARAPLKSLSDGYKRRVALAVQLARNPSLLLLDEPLAGLDWRARADIATLLGRLKSKCSILVVSHDLRELVPLVDYAWKMQSGGFLSPAEWPPARN